MEKVPVVRVALLIPVVFFLLYYGWFRGSMNMDRGPLHSGHSSSDNPPSTSQRLPILAGYFPAWSIYERNYNVADIDAEHLSHILYAFANIHENGTIILGDPWADTEKHFEKDQTVNHKADKWMANVNNLYGNFKQLYFLKRRHPNLKVSLSVGGWSWSTLFPTVAMDVEKRKRFAMSAAQHINDLGLDGIDIDWEFPKTEQEGQAFVTLLKDVRSALNDTQSSANNTPYLLSVAVGCGPDNYKYLHLREMDDYVDLFYLMAYDLAGAWNEKTGHQAALYRDKKINNVQQLTVHDAITHFAKMIPRHKLVMGLPMYGRSFSKTTGPYAEFDGVPDGTWEKGSYDYKDLPRPGALEIYDPEIGASWSYDAKLQEYVTYDNHQVVQQKAQYVMDQGLGGCFFWELTGGGSNDSQRNLLTAAFYSLGSKLDTTPNHLSYPASHYDNIRSFAT